MGLSPSLLLGLILVVLALGLLLLPLVLLRVLPRLRVGSVPPPPPPTSQHITPHSEAVLLIQSGGRVAYMNAAARELFNVWEDEPNLESLARRTRPSDAFLLLCAGEGQAHFSLNGRFVEGKSYYTPGSIGSGPEYSSAVLVSLHRPQIVLDSDSVLAGAIGRVQARPENEPADMYPAPDTSTQAFGIFTELSQAMIANLDLEDTISAILESCERLLPSDYLEITLWTEDRQYLAPYRLVGLSGVDRKLEKAAERYQPNEGYTGYLVNQRKPLLVPDVNTFRQVRPSLDRQHYPFRSYLGVPLLLAGDLIGTLELASLSKENYNESDQQVMQLIAGQAAVALKNALLYEQELARSTELAGLANLAQTVSSIRDPQDLYNRLIESLGSLLNVEILGFMIYNENRHILEGQAPFKGIHPDILQYCQTIIQPESLGAAIWQSGEAVITENAPDDPRIQALDLQGIAIAAGMRNTALVPLASGGHILGYLLAANKQDASPFDANDMRFLSIVSGQAAPILENAELVQQSRRRAQRAETLRRIASLTSSAATLDEILKFSVLDLARLLQADVAAIFLLDEARGELRANRASAFGVSPELIIRLGRLPIDDPQFPRTVTGSKKQYNIDDLETYEKLPVLYQPLVDEAKVRSVIDVPLIVSERGIGELIVGSFRPHFFTHGDLQTVATASGQLAAAIERANLYTQTDQGLRQRVDQLTALTRVSRELNTTLKLDDLLQRVYDEALRATHANCGTILLFDMEKAYAIRAGWLESSTPAPILFHFGDPPEENLHPMERQVLEDGEPIIVQDFEPVAEPAIVGGENGGANDGANGSQPSAPIWQPAHPGIRSALVIPIAYQGQVAGLIHLHSRAPHHFNEAEREITEALAVQAAIALGNAHRFTEQKRRTEELNRRVESLAKIFEVSQVLQTEQPLESALEAIAYAIQGATPFDVALISIYNPRRNHLERVAAAGIPLSVLAELRAHPAPWPSMQTLLDPKFRLGHTYFIPAEQGQVIPQDIQSYRPPGQNSPEVGPDNAWQPEDILIAPLFNTAGEPLGLVSLDSPRDGLRPDQPSIETIEIFCSQASLVIESQIKVRELKNGLAQAQSEMEMARQMAEQAQRHLPVLLHKDLERTLAVQQISQRARRIQAGLRISETISKQTGRSEVLQTLGQEILTQMDVDVVLIAESTAGGLSLTASLGNLPPEVNPKALLGQRNPLRQSIQSGAIQLVSDLSEDSDWQNTPLLRALDARSFFCFPIIDAVYGTGRSASKPNAALLGVHQTYTAPYTQEDRQLFDLMMRQTAIALQNLRLQEDTSRRLNEVTLLLDFSRQLGSLDPASILNTLIESAMHAVPAAQMAMVALWDARQNQLTPQAAEGYPHYDELMAVTYRPGEGLPGQVFETKQPANIEEVDFTRHYNLTPQNLLHYRNATSGRLPVSSLAVPIMAGGSGRGSVHDSQITQARTNPLGVLVMDNAAQTGAFQANDLAVITSLAQQTALTLENARLYQAARQRSGQLQALTAVATTITSSLRTEQLTATLLDQFQTILPFDTGTLWLRQKSADLLTSSGQTERMIIRAARGFADSEQRIGLVVDVQDSQLLNEMIQTGRPIWVSDVRKDVRFQALSLVEFGLEAGSNAPAETQAPVYEHLSWLGLPLIASGRVIGVIALEKAEPGFYSADDIQVAANFAGQAAAGLVNAELYEDSVQRAMELDQRSQTLTILNRLSAELSGSLDVSRILDVGVQEFMLLMDCNSASAILLERGESPLDRSSQRFILQAEYPYADNASPYLPGSQLPNAPIFDRLRITQGIFNFETVQNEPELAPLIPFFQAHDTSTLLIVPLVTAGTPGSEVNDLQFLGLLMAHGSPEQRFGADKVALARTISSQVGIALQNAHLLAETLSLTEDLEQRVQERTAELGRERQRAETLLRIISELSASLDLDQVLNRTLHVLSEYVDAAQITILIARPGEKRLNRLASIGYAVNPSADGNQTQLSIDEGLAGWIISQRQTVMIEDVLQDERWIQMTYAEDKWKPDFQHRSALGVPLMSGAEALGCLLLFHPEVGHFSMDQMDLVQAAANQVAVAVNNAELYRLIRDQAEDLGTMLRSQQVETSRSKAILEAVADGVLVTDARRFITLFNESSEKILGLERSQVLGKSMEHFSGLFGRATRRWMETISTWSQDPSAYHPGDTYAEQITLEDGRVIAVRLAPVSLRNDFLGTVSIFQDVTHQVEVDRLKSEFVATVSHELRTPMTSIKGYVEILLMGAAGQLTEQQAHFLQVVKTNTERLSVLVNDLLDISQIESGRVTLSRQPFNLEELIDQAIAELLRRYQGDDKHIRISKVCPPNLPRAYGDPDRIRRVVDNLLDNAYQYNLPEGQIEVTLSAHDETAQVDIHDTGVGVPPEDQERVFERFFRGESTLTLGVAGTGLGLSIVSNLIEMHGGRIWLTSNGIPGEGSTFSFTLPLYSAEQGQ